MPLNRKRYRRMKAILRRTECALLRAHGGMVVGVCTMASCDEHHQGHSPLTSAHEGLDDKESSVKQIVAARRAQSCSGRRMCPGGLLCQKRCTSRAGRGADPKPLARFGPIQHHLSTQAQDLGEGYWTAIRMPGTLSNTKLLVQSLHLQDSSRTRGSTGTVTAWQPTVSGSGWKETSGQHSGRRKYVAIYFAENPIGRLFQTDIMPVKGREVLKI